MLRPLFTRWLVPVLLVLATSPVSAAELLPDSTVVDSFSLGNGLQVRVRHIPMAAGVSITVGYRAGSAYDPSGREGLGALLAELQLTCAAAETPERTREELTRLRPLGWGIHTNERITTLTEIVTLEQFPGLLRQVGQRMRGVTVTDATFKVALEAVRRDIADRSFARTDLALYWRVREQALGLSDEAIVARASAAGLLGLKPKDVTAQLRKLYVPANACLALAGDFGNLDLQRLLETELGSIPGGTSQPEAVIPALVPSARAASWPGIHEPLGVVGAFAPELDNPAHPAFYLGILIMGSWLTQEVGRPAAPLSSRFQYSLFDQPDLVRFYPELRADDASPAALSNNLAARLDQVAEMKMEPGMIEVLRFSVDWMLGGLFSPGARDQMRSQGGALGTLTGFMATRALWKGDAFWDQYRQRFETTNLGHNMFWKWLVSPEHQAVLLFTPKP